MDIQITKRTGTTAQSIHYLNTKFCLYWTPAFWLSVYKLASCSYFTYMVMKSVSVGNANPMNCLLNFLLTLPNGFKLHIRFTQKYSML